MKKNLKKIFVCGLIAVMSMTMLTACGDNAKAQGSSDKGSVEVEQPKELTKDEYVQKVTDISNEVAEINSKYAADMNSSDMNTQAEATKKMVEEMKPLYEELGNLNAPAEMKDNQAKIKEGCDASLEVLDLSVELIDLSLNAEEADAEQITAKMQELTTKMQELSEKANGLTTALTEVMAA